MTSKTPSYLSLASSLLKGLAQAPMPADDDDDLLLPGETTEPESMIERLKRLPLAYSLPEDAIGEMIAEGEDPFAITQDGEVAPPRQAPNLFDALAAVRLAKTLGDETGLVRFKAPRALHILVSEERLMLDYTERVLHHSQAAGVGGPRHLHVLRFPERQNDRRQWQYKLPVYLGRPDPILIPCFSAHDLPAEVRQAATDVLELAPIDADDLLFALERVHSATGVVARDALRARMPDDEALGRLTASTIAAAFRAPTTLAVVARLTDLCHPPKPTAHNLALLEGMGDLETAARDLVADFTGFQDGRVAWRDMPRSVLFHGAPGTGKTFAAQVIAEAAGAHLVRGSLGEWQAAGHLGDLLKAMRETFAEARAKTPSILFVDEIDSFGARSDDGRNKNYRQQVINHLLEELNGLQTEEGCIVIAATNDVAALDPAIIRPGRFDRIVEVGLPGPAAVAQMLRHHLRCDLPEAELASLARQARGRTAAEIEAAVRTARGAARRAGCPLAASHVSAALAPKAEVKPDLEWRIAIHEAGHALVGHLLDLGRINAIRLTPAGGLTEIAIAHSHGLPGDIDAALAYQLAGRAAERLVLGTAGSGSGGPAHSDLARATQVALEAELSLGQGSTGLVWLSPDERHLANPQLRARLDDRLKAAEARALDLLAEARPTLEALAAALIRERVLEGDDLLSLLETASHPGAPSSSNKVSDLEQDQLPVDEGFSDP